MYSISAVVGVPGPNSWPMPRLAQRIHVLFGDDAAAGDEDVVAPLLVQQLANTRKQRHVRAAKNRQANDVDVFLDGGRGDHFRRLVEPCIDHFHAGVSERGGDDFRAAVVSVETWLGD